jgi:hypothetical protein
VSEDGADSRREMGGEDFKGRQGVLEFEGGEYGTADRLHQTYVAARDTALCVGLSSTGGGGTVGHIKESFTVLLEAAICDRLAQVEQ